MWNKGGSWDTPFNNKNDKIEVYLKNHYFGVLGVTEANISKENDSFEIKGYTVNILTALARIKCLQLYRCKHVTFKFMVTPLHQYHKLGSYVFAFGGNTAAPIQLPIFYSGDSSIMKLTATFLYLKVTQLYLYSYQHFIPDTAIFSE